MRQRRATPPHDTEAAHLDGPRLLNRAGREALVGATNPLGAGDCRRRAATPVGVFATSWLKHPRLRVGGGYSPHAPNLINSQVGHTSPCSPNARL